MAAIDLAGHATRDDVVRERKSLHPSCYLLIGLAGLIGAALIIDAIAGLIV